MKNILLRYICQLLLIFFILGGLLCLTPGYAETPQEHVNYSTNSDGTVAVIPLDIDMVTAAKEFVQQLQSSKVLNVSAMVHATPGLTPHLMLTGEKDEVRQALDLVSKLLPNTNQKHLVVIAASLRELTRFDMNNIGLDLRPDNMVQLSEDITRGKVLVSSEVYTPNGSKAEISNVYSVPVFSIDTNGNVKTQFQNLETSIVVVPTIVKYNPDKPEESLIRVDVDVKVSLISGERMLKGVSAPEYSVKTMTTTRVLKADNQSNVIGTFVSDSNIKTYTAIPVLGEIPLLKYLFSQEGMQKQRNTAVLSLTVRLLPVDPPEK